MEELLEKLQQQKTELIAHVLESQATSSAQQRKDQIACLKKMLEDLELVAAASGPIQVAPVITSPPNVAVLTEAFYAEYLLVVLLSGNLNDARFLWKRIVPQLKQESQLLKNVWTIGKALWQRDFAAAYTAMGEEWPEALAPLVALLRKVTQESTAGLLSIAYAAVSYDDASCALGIADETALLEYCQSLNWDIDAANRFIHPKPTIETPSFQSPLQQLDATASHVLHLEQSLLFKLG